MWRCPKCVAHVKDGAKACPVCKTPAPAPRRKAEKVDYDDREFDRPPPLVRDHARRDLRARAGGKDFWGAALVGGLPAIFFTVGLAAERPDRPLVVASLLGVALSVPAG